MLPAMSATQLLNQVKTMPARERRKFFDAVHDLELNQPPTRNGKSKRVAWPDVEARARRIFGNRTLPNLVLLAREEERW